FVKFATSAFFALLSIICARPASANFTTTTGNVSYVGNETRPVYQTFSASCTAYGTAAYAQDTKNGQDVPYNGVTTWTVLKQEPSWGNHPNEKILVTMDSQCRIVAQVWNGSSWGNIQ